MLWLGILIVTDILVRIFLGTALMAEDAEIKAMLRAIIAGLEARERRDAEALAAIKEVCDAMDEGEEWKREEP